MEGFAVLIEKDWLSFGHKFEDRHGHGKRNFVGDDIGPIFLQFLDAVHQIMVQNPTSFEFNDLFLIYVMESCYSCQYGTFLGNSLKERVEMKVMEKTESIWSYLLNCNKEYLNPIYDGDATKIHLEIDTRPCVIEFWSSYWLKYARDETTGKLFKSVEKQRLKRLQELLLSSKADAFYDDMIATFQREIKLLQSENQNLKMEVKILQADMIEQRKKYDIDIGSFISIVKKNDTKHNIDDC